MDFTSARALLVDAVATGVAPAAVVEVGRASGPIWQEAFGRHTYDADAPAATVDTIFDLASLTKVIATTSLVMRHIGAGHLRLDTPVADVLPAWRDERHHGIHIQHLLDHSSGLPGVARIWEHATGRGAYETAIHDLALDRPPGATSVYSDPGFMTLGFVVEEIGGDPLDDQFHDVATRWGSDLSYRPSPSLRARIAPTEFDAGLGRHHHGDVHDENAGALGGVAGHAGLFGTAAAVGAFARTVLDTFVRPTLLGSPALIRTFASRTGVPGSSRALGWDTMLPTSSCGTRLSPSSVGHTGFTGTSLWIDWERDRYVVLLTNRVHPTRSNERLIPLRPRLHDAIVAAWE